MVYVPTIALTGLTVFGQEVARSESNKSDQEVVGENDKIESVPTNGAAVAGLLAGTSASIQASNLAPGGRLPLPLRTQSKSLRRR